MATIAKNATDFERFDLLQSLDRFGWLKLATDCMIDCGPASQTLGGLLSISNRHDTFVRNERIADAARLPVRTVKRHLRTLADRGWIVNHGRQRTPGGKPRRTATRCVTGQARRCERFGVLPVWIDTVYATWAERAVFSVVMARAKAVAGGVNDTEASNEIECLADLVHAHEDRFAFSLSTLQGLTGLGRKAIADAKCGLRRDGLIEWIPSDTATLPDILLPSREKVIVSWIEGGQEWMQIQENPEVEGVSR